MQIFLAVFLFLLGILFTVRGGDSFVGAASRISEIFAVPKFIIGATVVSLATTLPELLVSLLAAADGKTEMAIGNAVGSVSANTGLILAISLIFMPPHGIRKMAFKFILLLCSSLSLLVFSLSGRLLPIGCAALVLCFMVFIFDNVKAAKTSSFNEPQPEGEGLLFSVFRFLVGASAIVIGAKLLVDNASSLARIFGISEAVIATTVLAIGTSLPELTTTLCAIKRREASLSIGNVLGANIIDLTVILPACSFLSGKPLPVSERGAFFDMGACFIIICIAAIPALWRGRLGKTQGFMLLLAYIFYIGLTIF